MKSEKIIEFIRHPEKINNDDLRELHTLVERYPYFQTARILYLKAYIFWEVSDFAAN